MRGAMAVQEVKSRPTIVSALDSDGPVLPAFRREIISRCHLFGAPWSIADWVCRRPRRLVTYGRTTPGDNWR